MDEPGIIAFYTLPTTAIFTLETSRVSVSTSTISLLDEKDGTVMSRTIWPSGPVMTFVPKLGWHPTK
jgi:hypothetical protein